MGEHGWFDKRFMYEESFRTPLLIMYPKMIKAGSVCNELVQNIDYAPTYLALAGVKSPVKMDGRSLIPLFSGENRKTGVKASIIIIMIIQLFTWFAATMVFPMAVTN